MKMVIADAECPSPARKRSRLSLKSFRHDSSTRSAVDGQSLEAQADTSEVYNENQTMQELSLSKDESSYSAEDVDIEPKVPAISSLENLGNTCFLNSVLQVLRYTPHLLESLDGLYNEVINVEKLRKQEAATKEDASSSDAGETTQTWELVKYLFKLYRAMSKREERYHELASSDVMSMALKPNKILNIIRELNPMFEGNLQHDAQELLKCILCYLQEAEREVHKAYSCLPPRMSPRPRAPINPIMQKFLLSSKNTMANGLNHCDDPELTLKSPTPSTIKANLFSEPDILDQIERSEAAKTVSPRENHVPNSGGQANVNNSASSLPVASGCPKDSATPTASLSDSVLSCDSSMSLSIKRRKGRPKKGIETPRNSPAVTSQPRRSKRSSEIKETNVMETDNKKLKIVSPNSGSGDSTQPSILAMFSKSPAPCKRLGMRGAVIKKPATVTCMDSARPSGLICVDSNTPDVHGNVNSIKAESSSKIHGQIKCNMSETELTANEDSSAGLSSRLSSLHCQSSTNQAFVRLENCDRVCDSPKKSVSANYAMKCLSPSKSSQSPWKNGSQPVTSEWSSVNSCNQNGDPSPFVKIENCSHVCDSPKMSVDAGYATGRLTPVKSALSKSPRKSTPASVKLDFDMDLGKGSRVTYADHEAISQVKMEKPPRQDCSPSKFVLSPGGSKKRKKDIVERYFQGTLMLRTRCMECEVAREKREEFHDISVPLQGEKPDSDDEESDEDSNSCLSKLMVAFTAVERLRDDNKYFCDKCHCYVEAERSLHYEVLPDILTLHLKRFSTTSGLFGYISKINDHVNVPLSLPCLRYKCPKPCCRPDHRYRLYALVTHAGMTLSSGHYLSYVRVLPESIPGQTNSKPAKNTPSSTNVSDSGSRKKMAAYFTDKVPTDKKLTCLDAIKEVKTGPSEFVNQWVQCDDETIRVFSEDEFRDMLSGKEGSLLGSPYVLFYCRMHPGMPW